MIERLRYCGRVLTQGVPAVFAALGAVGLVTGLALPSLEHSFRHDRPWLITIGLLLFLCAIIEGGYQLTPDPFTAKPIDADHELGIKHLLQACALAVQNQQRCDYIDDGGDRQTITAHFPGIAADTVDWNDAVAAVDQPRRKFADRARAVAESHGLDRWPFSLKNILDFVSKRSPGTLYLSIEEWPKRLPLDTNAWGATAVPGPGHPDLIVGHVVERNWTEDEIAALTAPLAPFFDEVRQLYGIAAVRMQQEKLKSLQDSFAQGLTAPTKRVIHPSRDCDICRHNADVK